MPYGEDRTTTPTGWKGTKGYLGATKDDTGLTHLGAREYDPTLGRFTSVDPIMDLGDPQQWNAYGYANGNPVTWSDPSGLIPEGGQDENGNAIIPVIAGAGVGAAVASSIATAIVAGVLIEFADYAAKNPREAFCIWCPLPEVHAFFGNVHDPKFGPDGVRRTNLGFANGRWIFADGSIRNKKGTIIYSPAGSLDAEHPENWNLIRGLDVYDPVTGQRITDIDEISELTLWELKSASRADDIEGWVQDNVTNKLESYVTARMYIPGYEDAPLGMWFTEDARVEPAFRAAVESAVAEFRQRHPSITVQLRWGY